MNPYLSRLRALKNKNTSPLHTLKTLKTPGLNPGPNYREGFEGFEGAQGMPVFNFGAHGKEGALPPPGAGSPATAGRVEEEEAATGATGNGWTLARTGRAITDTPEDRRELEPGAVIARVWIKEIEAPALATGADDDLSDMIVF
jgi:hypothetical protein